MLRIGLLAFVGLVAGAAMAQEGDVSVERGAHIAIIGGCHDCHTPATA